ncbi:MAG TPA: DUF72 domain-containing protein [Geobacter sp.]|nr:DUF72 domain-containing protein [Geobacter sp.]
MTTGKIRIGTCSWTEKSLVESGVFYPSGASTPKARLRFYSGKFDTVEVDSSYYAIPTMEMAKAWADRTPEQFLFHLKAYGALTGHTIDPRRLPEELRRMLPEPERDREELHVSDPETLRAMASAMLTALEPLKKVRKMGFVIFQFPPWFGHKNANMDYLLYCKELMAGTPIAVEFRHGSWLTSRHRDDLFSFLREHKITYITCDEPQLGTLATAPFHPEATTSVAYLRLHGRNAEEWQARAAAGDEYLYRETELNEIATEAVRLSEKTRLTFVMFNNCRGGCAVRNALQMRERCSQSLQHFVATPSSAPAGHLLPEGEGIK